ncbi:TadE/TadG family type IV pilus assembly protein [Oceaniovalibus sp. ACAM 378]|uniref:TadE/TadG family type IV pilus assembly protein n=1 Tax=Oceaniovalibus sp. ACAM 378 TaxID=2599923 RepID=UPI0011D5439D|nr:hypothetical protein [Oceaniovalibus sp. ACAM 378]TYB87660.1 hypothetical protein FQ320_13720 [Oceaniovalibus sp. ACAM 378]
MKLMAHLRSRIRAFAQNTSGSLTIETVLVLPMLLWGVLATFTFVDGYRMQSMNLRATYTISDLLTRQWNPVDQSFMTGIGNFHKFLTNEIHATAMRVSVVYWDEPNDRHVLVWSYTTESSKPKVKQSDMAELSPGIPALANADTAVIVETWMSYVPPFSIGLPSSEFHNRVIASPRFVPQLLWSTS